jgi:hypothetical protein
MIEWFENILAKKERCVKHSNIEEEKKVERLHILMAATEKKLNCKEKKTKLGEMRVELASASEIRRC